MNRLTKKKKLKEILGAHNKQIRKDMDFWIKYRPSRWGDLLPQKFIKPILKLLKRKGGKNFFLLLVLIFSLIFVGVIPTFNFIWSHIFRVWLSLLLVPIVYWVFAITSVYIRVLVLFLFDFLRVLIDKLIDR